MNANFDERNIEERKGKGRKYTMLTYIFVFTVAIFAMFTVDLFMFSPVEVKGESMVATLMSEDIVIVNKLKKPQIGDIIVLTIDTQNGKEQWIKRLIGIGGDTVWAQEGVVYRRYEKNGETVTEALVEDYVSEFNKHHTDFEPVYVPYGEVFFMGDNRGVSWDSRRVGTIKENRIVGVVTGFSLKHKDIWKKLLA